jgi:nucleoside 2-deoxyribosyltransferase
VGAFKVYLAGSSREPQRVREMAERIDATGIEITQRWWEPSDHGTPEEWGGKDGSIPRGVQAQLCRGNMRAIAETDVVFVLWPENGVLSTCAVELGFAVGKGKPLVVTGTRSHECTWTALEDTYRDPCDLLGHAEVARRAVEACAVGLRSKRWK